MLELNKEYLIHWVPSFTGQRPPTLMRYRGKTRTDQYQFTSHTEYTVILEEDISKRVTTALHIPGEFANVFQVTDAKRIAEALRSKSVVHWGIPRQVDLPGCNPSKGYVITDTSPPHPGYPSLIEVCTYLDLFKAKQLIKEQKK